MSSAEIGFNCKKKKANNDLYDLQRKAKKDMDNIAMGIIKASRRKSRLHDHSKMKLIAC